MTHGNAEDLTANVLVGRSVRHRSTVEFARHLSYDRTATVDKIAQPILADLHSNLRGARAPPRLESAGRDVRYWHLADIGLRGLKVSCGGRGWKGSYLNLDGTFR